MYFGGRLQQSRDKAIKVVLDMEFDEDMDILSDM